MEILLVALVCLFTALAFFANKIGSAAPQGANGRRRRPSVSPFFGSHAASGFHSTPPPMADFSNPDPCPPHHGHTPDFHHGHSDGHHHGHHFDSSASGSSFDAGSSFGGGFDAGSSGGGCDGGGGSSSSGGDGC